MSLKHLKTENLSSVALYVDLGKEETLKLTMSLEFAKSVFHGLKPINIERKSSVQELVYQKYIIEQN
jgi:hypothetical protein